MNIYREIPQTISPPLSPRKENMDKFDSFKVLFKRFIDGTRWINERMVKGINVDKDKEDFNRTVVEPMDALWAEFTDEGKDYWLKVSDAVRIFNGRIV